MTRAAGDAWLADVAAIRFAGGIRYWKPERASGLAVVDVPDGYVETFGGLKQQRVRGTIDGVESGEEFVEAAAPAGRVELRDVAGTLAAVLEVRRGAAARRP